MNFRSVNALKMKNRRYALVTCINYRLRSKTVIISRISKYAKTISSIKKSEFSI